MKNKGGRKKIYSSEELKEHRKEYYLRDAKKSCLRGRQWRLKQYGLTIEQHTEMLRLQDGKCAICGTSNPGRAGWATDHCHTANIVRGILCTRCNRGLGFFRDDPLILAAAIRYLSKHLRETG